MAGKFCITLLLVPFQKRPFSWALLIPFGSYVIGSLSVPFCVPILFILYSIFCSFWGSHFGTLFVPFYF
jgi:hypothetical protein